MSDLLSSMYDDFDKYEARCIKIGVPVIDDVRGGLHTDWVNLKYEGKIELSYEEYVRIEKIKKLNNEITRKNEELKQLMFELSELVK